MKVLIAGLGHLGEQAAHLLSAGGHEVTVIELDRARAAAAAADGVFRTVHGDACEPTVLETAGALATDLMLAATGDDEDNLVICLLARRRYGVGRTLAKVNDPDDAWLFDAEWGVDIALPAAAPLVGIVREAAGGADTVDLVRLGGAGIAVVETVLISASHATGRTVAELTLPADTVAAAVVNDGHPFVPADGYRFRPGDRVLVVTSTATEEQIHDAFHGPSKADVRSG